MRTLFAVFKNYSDAEEAVDEMMDKGFPLDEMNAVTQDSVVRSHLQEHLGSVNIEAAFKNRPVEIGGLDRLVGGKKAISVSDVGQVFAGGKIARMLTRANCEPVHSCNGLKPALLEMDVPEEKAKKYSEGIKGGGVLLFLRSGDSRSSEAAGIIRAHNGEEIGAVGR